MDTPASNPTPRTLGPAALPTGPAMDHAQAGARPGRPAREFAANATLVSREDLTESIARFVVRPDGGVPPFKPGQYFALGLSVDGTVLQRPYSTASRAGEAEHLEFLIRRVNAGAFTPRLWGIGSGARVWLGPPKGLFTLRPGDHRTHLLVSTGTGLAPFISMTDTLLRSENPSAVGGPTADRSAAAPRVVVVHGVSYQAELAYRELLEDHARAGRLAYVPTISRPVDPGNSGWTGATGRTESVLSRACDELEIDPHQSVAYVCGNPEMIEAVVAILRHRGFPEAMVIREHYWTTS
ncbi:MAG: FAD-binding oxidoreductase [Candidatus Limnocylindrales bacterium]